jgi:hypothetical protein
MKPLGLPKESKEALLNGAGMFLIPCDLCRIESVYDEAISPYQIGEQVYIAAEGILLMSNPPQPKIIYKATIKDVKVVRLHDISFGDWALILGNDKEDNKVQVPTIEICSTFYNKQYGNYEDTPYVFLYEIEEKN